MYDDPADTRDLQASSGTETQGRIVIGARQGEHLAAQGADLYTLASPAVAQLMHEAHVDGFAVDDLIVLTNSDNFRGWNPGEIVTTCHQRPLPVPDEIEALRMKKLPEVAAHFINSSHYRLASYIPAFRDRKALEVTLAPIGFHDYYTLATILDEPLLSEPDGVCTLRQKYGKTAFHYAPSATCVLPTPVCIQGVLLTRDKQIILMQRSQSVAFYPGHWSASFEETMNAPGPDPHGVQRAGDSDFFACALRGLEEEFGLPVDVVEDLKVLSLNLEYLLLAVGVVSLIKVDLEAEAIRTSWLLKAADRNEASTLATVPMDLPTVVKALFGRTLWHPTSRMRLIQTLFHFYGIDQVAAAIQAHLRAI
jgi:hypothetical protein